MSEYINDEKLASHLLFPRKKGLTIYLAALKMGLFGTHIRTMQYIGNNPYDLNRNKAMHNATVQLFCNWKNYTFIPSATRAKIWYQQNAFKPPVA